MEFCYLNPGKELLWKKENLKFPSTPVSSFDTFSLPGSQDTVVNFFPRAGFSGDRTSRSRRTYPAYLGKRFLSIRSWILFLLQISALYEDKFKS